MIRDILGATGDGRQQLRLHPSNQLSCIHYVFIENDEDVRACLLSNPVLDDPLDLLVYCHRQEPRFRQVVHSALERAQLPSRKCHRQLD